MMFPETINLLLNDTCPTDPKAWEALVTWACRHELGPLIHYHFKGQGHDCVLPPAVNTRLRYTRYAAQAVSLVREQAWTELLNALQTAGISILVLKGAALAYTVYPDPVLRSTGDIDLLLNPRDLPGASAILKGLGFEPEPEPQQRINPFNTGWTGELSFVRKHQGMTIAVDLHWQLFAIEWLRHITKVDVEALWEHAIPFSIGQVTAHTLACEDMLFHVCLHISLHGFTHFRGYVDIVQLLEYGDLDWNLFLQRVRANGFRVACYFPLWWLAQYRAGIVPDEVLIALRPDPLRATLGKWLIKQGVQREPDTGHAWNHVAQMFVVDRIADYSRLFVWLLFPGRAWLQERYHVQTPWQLWGWTLLHPLIVLREGILSVGALLAMLLFHGRKKPAVKDERTE